MKNILTIIKGISIISFLALTVFACDPDPIVEPTDLRGNISGKVKTQSGAIIIGASITADGLDEVISNSEGVFTYTDIAAESYTLNATKEGYLDNSIKVRVVGNKTVDIIIELIEGINPTVSISTIQSENIGMTNAEVNGNITSIGSDDVLSYGHCWSTNSEPTITDDITNFGTTNINSAFTTNLTDLQSGTQYYIRSYASNRFGITYSNQLTFETLPGEPTVTTNAASDIEFNMAKITANLTAIGASTVTQHGHVWSENVNPTIADFKTELGAKLETGNFESTITDLEMETKYYIRAYAVNSDGISYSDNESFTTSNNFIDKRDSKSYKIIKIGDQVWMQENLNYEEPGSICHQFLDYDCSVYGRFYDWNTAQTAVPAGWHLPSEAEWNILINELGGEAVAGGKLKYPTIAGIINYWEAPNTGAATADNSNFKAYGAGYIDNGNTPLEHLKATMFWMSDNINSTQARCLRLSTSTATATKPDYVKEYSLSIRCILD